MTRIDHIKAEIEQLSLEERADLARWFYRWADDDWDRKIAADARAGRLDKLIAEADRQIDAGELRDLP